MGGVPAALPDGDPAPADGRLSAPALESVARAPLGVYVHVPFCAVRCGYCDFNTYTPGELGGGDLFSAYVEAALAEVRLAAGVLGPTAPPVSTVFFGGGTPTLLPASELGRLLHAVRDGLGLAADAEITTECNPDSVGRAELAALREAGFNRISFGMQSAVPHVLRVLDRTHDPKRVPDVVGWAREAGFEQVSLDLIYGTPGESLEDWRSSLEAALDCRPDHVSAYALIVEEGTALARRIRRGEVPMPDDDDLADKYLLADEALTTAGLSWYEVSNWAVDDAARCRHNLAYWTGTNWWGIGPGSHSHVGGTRWWNVKHPRAYADRLRAGESPAQAREVLDEETRRVERVLLEVRLRQGLPRSLVGRPGLVEAVLQRGLADLESDRLVLTTPGRLLADAVVRDLLD